MTKLVRHPRLSVVSLHQISSESKVGISLALLEPDEVA